MFGMQMGQMGLVGQMTLAQRIAYMFAHGKQGVWYDPSDFSTLFQDSAGTTPVTAVEQPVGRILDKSGRGNHATQSTTTKRPTLKQDENGCYYLRFDGVDDALQTGNINFTSTDKMTVWAGFNKSSDAAVGYLLYMGASGGRLDIRAPASAGSNISTNAISSAGASIFASTLATGYAANMGISYSATVDFAAAAGSECTSRVNGVAVPQNGGLTQENTGVFGSQILTIGQFVGGSYFNGRLYQLIVRGAQSSLSQLEAGELLTRSRMKLP